MGMRIWEKYQLASSVQMQVPSKCPGWARRPKHGNQYGANHLSEFKKEIEELFDTGRITNEKKLSPQTMLEHIRNKYPHRYTLPGETEIRQEISSLFYETEKESKKK